LIWLVITGVGTLLCIVSALPKKNRLKWVRLSKVMADGNFIGMITKSLLDFCAKKPPDPYSKIHGYMRTSFGGTFDERITGIYWRHRTAA